MKKHLVVANWKMYIESPATAAEFCVLLRRRARKLSGVEVMIAPPAPLLPTVAEVLESSPVLVGAQTVSAFETGAQTGGVSAKMLKECGASFVIVGHSERRASGEDDTQVREQLLRAVEGGLAPILCIGESEREQDGGHFSFIERQLSAALMNLPKVPKGLIVAYEPVWAIGKGAQDAIDPQTLEEMVIFIKKTLTEVLERKLAMRVPILYGGSVEPSNTHGLLTQGGVSGFLVGRASTDIDSFVAILTQCK